MDLVQDIKSREDRTGLIASALLFGLAYGVFRRSRACAVISLIFVGVVSVGVVGASLATMVGGSLPAGGIAGLIVGIAILSGVVYLLFLGVLASYAHRRTTTSSDDAAV